MRLFGSTGVLLLGAALLACSSPGENSALYRAIGKGDVAEVRSLLDGGANPNSTLVEVGFFERRTSYSSKRPPSPLVFAIREGQGDCAIVLLERGASVDYRDDAGFTPLEHAISKGDARLVAAILGKGGDAKADSKFGFPLVLLAACDGKAEIAAALLRAGAAVDARDRSGKAVEHCVGNLDSVYARMKGRSGSRIRPGATAMMVAAQRGFTDSVRAFLDAGADVNARDDAGRSALVLVTEEGVGTASSEGLIAIAKLLVDRGIDVGVADENGDTALMRARTLAGLSPTHAEIARVIETAGRR